MYLPSDLKEWYINEAEKNGFNLTTMIQVAMLDYKKQQEAMQSMNTVNSIGHLLNGSNTDLAIAQGFAQAIRDSRS